MIISLLAAAALVAAPAHAAQSDRTSLSSLMSRISSYLNAPAVRRAPRTVAVAAVRGGIPTDQGENLDKRLMDRADALRGALLRPDATSGDARALSRIYDALAASNFVQALAVENGGAARAEPTTELARWTGRSRTPDLAPALKTLLTGPAEKINDKSLVTAGWGAYVRQISPSDARTAAPRSGWAVSSEVARVDEMLKGLREALVQKQLKPESQVRAYTLAGQLLDALSKTDLRGKADASATSAPVLAEEDSAAAAPSAAAPPFEPRTIYQSAAKSVVLLLCASAEGSGELGTGSVIDVQKRRILTNAHVVIRDSTHEPWQTIHVYFKPAQITGDPKEDLKDPVEGKVVSFDRALDLAVVEVPSLPSGVGAIGLGDARSVSVGDRVAAIGHPEQGGLWTLTTGIVSTIVANIGGVPGKNAFQTDTSINRGNSGGPLLDSSGRIVGVNTSMARKAADGLAITSVNFSLRSDVAKRWMTAHGEPVSYANGAAPAVASNGGGAANRGVAAGESLETPRAAPPAAKAVAAAPAPTPKTYREGKAYEYSADEVIAAEIAEMEKMGDEMHQEIQRKLGR